MAPIKGLIAGAAVIVFLGQAPEAGKHEDAGLPHVGDHGNPPEQPAPQQPAQPDRSPTAAMTRTCDRMAAPWGRRNAAGTPGDPVRGPYRLVRLLRQGDTGCLRAGTYTETETLVKRQQVTLRSAPGERATWRGRVVMMGAHSRLTDLNLDGSAGPRCRARSCGTLPSPTINAPDVTVARDDITSPGSGICVHPRTWKRLVPNRFRILDNRIHDCGRRPPTEHDHGIYVADGWNGTIEDNVVYENADRGIQLYPDAHDTTVVHNTVDGNGSGLVFSERSSGNVVKDNVFTNSVVRWNAETFALVGRGNRFVGNCVKPGNAHSMYDRNGGIALPGFVVQRANRRAADGVYRNRAAGDLRIDPSSACAGTGASDRVALEP